ncbi:MAG: hypothetical protein M1296_06860 [Chloroflexi bacterium]|nr:hypothetical protein [Chloroflexota bacterium]
MMDTELRGASTPDVERLLTALADQDFLGQLLERRGRARELALEGGDVKLDWVDGVEHALNHSEWLEALADEAVSLLERGIRRVIWSGMGGSVQTVYTLQRLGLLDSPGLSIRPLDSTDPAALNRLLCELAQREHLHREDRELPAAAVRELLSDTAMIGVSMGMTSEEPITHLTWFDELLVEHRIPNPQEHIEVMTLPGSFLDAFAERRGARRVPIQLDGANHTAGRMSAPATRVFLRPAALMFAAQGLNRTEVTEYLRTLLRECQSSYGVSYATTATERYALTLAHPYLRLGAFVASEAKARRRNKTVLICPPAWRGVAPWIEQLVEESLGKNGKGWLVFYDQSIKALASRDDCIFLDLAAGGEPALSVAEREALDETERPLLQLGFSVNSRGSGDPKFAAVAGLFANWKLAVWAFGYLHDIVVAGQPGVEAYKAYARELRDARTPIPFDVGPDDGGKTTVDVRALEDSGAWTSLEEQLRQRYRSAAGDAPATLAAALRGALRCGIRYLDLTFNGEITEDVRGALEEARRTIGFQALRLPVKLRCGPSDYHSTEQSEIDGPAELLSVRIVALEHEKPIAGVYPDRFLLAQARGTWQAMWDARRHVVMVTLPTYRSAGQELHRLFTAAAMLLA